MKADAFGPLRDHEIMTMKELDAELAKLPKRKKRKTGEGPEAKIQKASGRWWGSLIVWAIIAPVSDPLLRIIAHYYSLQ